MSEYLTPIQTELLKELKKGESLTRAELVKKLDKPRTTIYDNLLKLQERKMVKKYPKYNEGRGRGRPLVLWFIPRKLLHQTFKEIGNNKTLGFAGNNSNYMG